MILSRNTGLVWLKRVSVVPLMILLAACGSDGSVIDANAIVLSWTAPSNRADGSIIEDTEISGYLVYYGKNKGSYPNQLFVNSVKVLGKDVVDISAGKYFVVVTTVDANGRKSDFSAEHELSL